MAEKIVVVHRSAIEEWSTREKPPLPLAAIEKALRRIEQVVREANPNNIIFVEQSPNTKFDFLPAQVGPGNSAILYGARVGYCLRMARVVLEDGGIPVAIDPAGCLP